MSERETYGHDHTFKPPVPAFSARGLVQDDIDLDVVDAIYMIDPAKDHDHIRRLRVWIDDMEQRARYWQTLLDKHLDGDGKD